MSELVLPIFPQDSLTASVVTTVWIGVAVVAFLNLRLGWVLSGLVVPGYLVPLLIIKPWAVAVILLESIITYWVVWFFSEYLSRFGLWSCVFGRDRFFALVATSIVVRLVFDGWLLPDLGYWLTNDLGLVFDYRNNLHSFGLVIVALMANQYWKTGLLRGFYPLLVSVGLTYLIVRYGLMEFTNFTISNLGYMYEDVAASMLASPKAYVILLTVAFVASRMNLLYGWDFSGILIPSLLALQWYQPSKLLTSFAEAFVILLTAHWLLSTRLFQKLNMEGARKLLLFFNVGFAYKIALGYFVLRFFPELKVTDTYAFGYLLSTLMAVKMHDKDIAARLTRATLQTSFVGVAIASVIGFSLTLLPLDVPWGERQTGTEVAALQRIDDRTLEEQVREDKLLLYQAQERGQMPVPLTTELDGFRQALSALNGYVQQRDQKKLTLALGRLQRVGYEMLLLEGRYLYLRETSSARGWGIYVINLDTPGRLLVEIPAPLNERGTLESGARLFRVAAAQGLAIAGTRRRLNADGSSDVLLNRQSFFHVFHHVVGKRDVLQVRALTSEIARVTRGLRRSPDQVELHEPTSSLWVNSQLPPSLDLALLKELVGEIELNWRGMPLANRQRDSTRSGFAELVLSQTALRRMRTRAIRLTATPRLQLADQRIDGFLLEWLLSERAGIAPRGSNAYQPAGVDELLFFDEEVLTPLIVTMRDEYRHGDWSERGLEELAVIQSGAAALGYALTRYRHVKSGQDYLILHESVEQQPKRHWGMYVFRLGPAAGYLVQVPRPLYEMNSFEYGVSLFERLDAKYFLVTGADPGANLDGSADLVRLDHFSSLFSLVNQVVLREERKREMLVIHSRARGYRPGNAQSDADIVIAVKGAIGGDRVPPLVDRLVARMEEDGLSHEFVDGRRETAGYEVGELPQSLYLDAVTAKWFCALWLSPQARTSFRQQDNDRQESAQFAALGIETEELDLHAFVTAGVAAETGTTVPPALEADIRRYVANADVVSLRALQHDWPRNSWRRIIDRDSRQSFLAVYDGQARLALVANLNPRSPDSQIRIGTRNQETQRVSRFVETRAAWLRFEDAS